MQKKKKKIHESTIYVKKSVIRPTITLLYIRLIIVFYNTVQNVHKV